MENQPILVINDILYTINDDGVLVQAIFPIRGLLKWTEVENHDGNDAKRISDELISALP